MRSQQFFFLHIFIDYKTKKDVKDIVRLCCVIKPRVTWNFERVGTTCRERCGGQGYLSVNRFSGFIGLAHSGMTAEGDNSVLMQKVSKELLADVKSGLVKLPNVPDAAAALTWDLSKLENLMKLFILRERSLLQEVSSKQGVYYHRVRFKDISVLI